MAWHENMVGSWELSLGFDLLPAIVCAGFNAIELRSTASTLHVMLQE
jgi:hypothetical protein